MDQSREMGAEQDGYSISEACTFYKAFEGRLLVVGGLMLVYMAVWHSVYAPVWVCLCMGVLHASLSLSLSHFVSALYCMCAPRE